jgi:hypothetical protein
MRALIVLLAVVFCLGFKATSVCADEPLPLYNQLEKAFASYQEAIKTKDVVRLQKAWSSYSYSKWRNIYITRNLRFPEDFFKEWTEVTEIKGFTRGTTSLRGDTASQTYFILRNNGPDNPTVMRVLFFAKENGRWKYHDETRLIRVSSEDSRRLALKQKNSPFLEGVMNFLVCRARRAST